MDSVAADAHSVVVWRLGSCPRGTTLQMNSFAYVDTCHKTRATSAHDHSQHLEGDYNCACSYTRVGGATECDATALRGKWHLCIEWQSLTSPCMPVVIHLILCVYTVPDSSRSGHTTRGGKQYDLHPGTKSKMIRQCHTNSYTATTGGMWSSDREQDKADQGRACVMCSFLSHHSDLMNTNINLHITVTVDLQAYAQNLVILCTAF